MPPQEGRDVAGQEIGGLKPHQVCARGIGRTFQVVRAFPRMTVLENVVIGAFVGWKLTLMTLMMASFAGSIVGLGLIISRRGGMKYALPFGTFLAMGAALPVVATAVAGIPEVVDDGRTGLLVPPGDTAALGAALGRVAADATLRERLGLEARGAVLPRFGVDRYVTSVTDLYDRLLRENS